MTKEKCARITDVVSLCGGGIPAVYYASGILYALHKTGKLLETVDGEKVLNRSFLFTASSGGVLPLLIVDCILQNNLHNTRDDWFEYYIIKSVEKVQPNCMAQLYLASFIKSIAIYNGTFSEIIRLCNETIKALLISILPPEIYNGKSLIFANKPCSQLRYNYVVDSAFNDSPILSNDFTHLDGIDIVTQISELITACCIAISFSYIKDGTLNDAALLVDNDILGLDNYINLKNIYYFSLNAYDAKTNNSYRESKLFSVPGFRERSSRIQNYRAINNLKTYTSNACTSGQHINFILIVFPNKYNPQCKYNNKIYKDLVPNIFLQTDFIETFTGIFNGDSRMLQLMFLIGAFETMHVNNISQDIADTLTDTLPVVYTQTLDDPYNVYFKQDPLSILGRITMGL
jgi:hypothetical protein